jgi:peptidoglycan/xylan/chitin deacetylase (PgdA/CDA1 family)
MDDSLGHQVGDHPRSLYFLYHELRPGGSQYSYVLDTSEFARHLDLFVEIRNMNAGVLRPEITFDDGHMSNFDYALPALKERGLKARFFITAGWTGSAPGYMGPGELRALSDAGQIIGAHGWSHRLLTHCTGDQLRDELRRPKQTLEDILGVEIDTMSLPGGRFNREVLEACQREGYKLIYSSIPRAEARSFGATVGRLNVLGGMEVKWLEELLLEKNSALVSLGRQYRMKSALRNLLGDRLYERLWAVVNRRSGEAANEDPALN